MLRLQFKPLKFHPTFGPRFDLERVIDDFILICMFVGNDFLPHLPHMDIADGTSSLPPSLPPSLAHFLPSLRVFAHLVFYFLTSHPSLPPSLPPSLGALNMMMAVYREAVPNLLGGYITDKAKVRREGGREGGKEGGCMRPGHYSKTQFCSPLLSLPPSLPPPLRSTKGDSNSSSERSLGASLSTFSIGPRRIKTHCGR